MLLLQHHPVGWDPLRLLLLPSLLLRLGWRH
jgi:hypothetical protein